MGSDTLQTTLIIIAAFVILGLLVVCAAVGVIVFLGLMGPSVGNVYSTVITAIPTSTPVAVP